MQGDEQRETRVGREAVSLDGPVEHRGLGTDLAAQFGSQVVDGAGWTVGAGAVLGAYKLVGGALGTQQEPAKGESHPKQ